MVKDRGIAHTPFLCLEQPSINTVVPFPPHSHRKYNSLIQAQARELSHLRQRIREGQGVSHILTQHLGDTTKVLQLKNDITEPNMITFLHITNVWRQY